MDSQQADVDRWRKVVELGSGRTGCVTLCIEPTSPPGKNPIEEKTCGVDHHHGTYHAVKRVPRRCMRNEESVRRILQEKKALQALRGHAGIVRLHFTSRDDEYLYFVLEPLLGGPLHRHIRATSGGYLEVPVGKFYAAEITSAIAHMHRHGFVHRDLKASNVVLGANGHVKLVDFGCSKQLEKKGGASNPELGAPGGVEYKKTLTYCGTPHCMAPEMVSREGHGFAVDWWALGILIHEMLNGEPPFGYTGDELSLRIAAGLPRESDGERPPSDEAGGGADSTNGNSKAHLDEPRFLPIVRELLETDPGQRLGSTRDAEDVMSHTWFEAVNWTKTAKHQTEPPAFRKDIGELELLEDEAGVGASVADVDPDGVFAGF